MRKPVTDYPDFRRAEVVAQGSECPGGISADPDYALDIGYALKPESLGGRPLTGLEVARTHENMARFRADDDGTVNTECNVLAYSVSENVTS